MADARWMDADCIHGVAWFECQRCDTLHQARQLAAKARTEGSASDDYDCTMADLLDLLAPPVPDTGAEMHDNWREAVWGLPRLGDEPVPDTGAES